MVGTVSNGRLAALSTESASRSSSTPVLAEMQSNITRSSTFVRKARHLGFNVKFPNFQLLTPKSKLLQTVCAKPTYIYRSVRFTVDL